MSDSTPAATGEHTPESPTLALPLCYDTEYCELLDARGRLVTGLETSSFNPDEDDAHGAELALACNSYPMMLAALESCERTLWGRTDDEANLPSDLQAMLAEIRETVAAAKGGSA